MFEPASEDEIKAVIMKSPSKSCELDPVPTFIIKQCVDAIVPHLTLIVNKSLQSGHFSDSLKVAHIRPLLKKIGLDIENLKNYRPVSNLTYLGKTIERVVSKRMSEHISINNLSDPFQSAYKAHHGTETALLRVNNDILTALDNGEITALILLDLSAAFDTVDHSILLERLQSCIGVGGTALKWCSSYLFGRNQRVCIGDSVSDPVYLNYSVPQGSVLGPQWFLIYTYPLRNIVSKYNLSYHSYADDTQLYMSFKPSQKDADTCISCLEDCIRDIRLWMKHNFLKLNDDKSEFILFGSHQQLAKVSVPHVEIGGSSVPSSIVVRNLGVMFDSAMSLKPHVSNVIRNSALHLRNIGRLRKYLNRTASEQVVHAFVTSRLDMANSLLYGLPQEQLNRLQRIQNIAARVVTRSKKSCHITPILKDLHWLPVRYRIVYKILLIVYKAVNGISPLYISNLLSFYTPSRNLRSNEKLLLIEPKSKHSWGDRSFVVAAPRLWNELPLSIRTSPSLEVFKKNLKTYLILQAYVDV